MKSRWLVHFLMSKCFLRTRNRANGSTLISSDQHLLYSLKMLELQLQLYALCKKTWRQEKLAGWLSSAKYHLTSSLINLRAYSQLFPFLKTVSTLAFILEASWTALSFIWNFTSWERRWVPIISSKRPSDKWQRKESLTCKMLTWN